MANHVLHIEDFAKGDKKALKDQFGEGNAHLIWVMSMYLDEPNAEQLGVDCLTDQPNDKKLDFVYLDPDGRRLVFAQGYFTQKVGGTAPGNKASDLNTAAAWLLSGDLDKVPEDIADTIRECRAALDKGEIDQIEFVYVHNLAESKNVSDEWRRFASMSRSSWRHTRFKLSRRKSVLKNVNGFSSRERAGSW